MSGLDRKASYALSQSVRSSKQAFENYRALDGINDQYCRLAGALNPESSDTAGRDELMGVFNIGYQGKTELEAVKKYLTDMYDRSINPALDANKSDAEGGRHDSIRKCFGIDVIMPQIETNTRFSSENIIDSSKKYFDIPTNPGISPAHCLCEVRSRDPKNIWSAGFERNAPPVGNGVYWIWGTSDGWAGRPLNEAYVFYYNFVNPGKSLTATLVGAIDDKGSIKINDTLYDNLGADPNNGVGIEPREVSIKRGVNTIEIRAINSGGPAGVWAMIYVNNNILLKTGCDGWKCARFFNPPEVFHVNGYDKSFSDGPSVCQRLGARVATYAELKEAQQNHANWCSAGWVSDQGDGNAFYPITYQLEEGCGNGKSGVMDWIGDDHWFGGRGKGYKAGVNCFGNKPDETSANALVAPQSILPYNKNQWSRYSPGTSPPVVSPPLPPITVWEGCDKGKYSWTRKDLASTPRVYRSVIDFPSDTSYIDVPTGITAILKTKGSNQMTLVGPSSLNFCSIGGGFNDNVDTIEILPT